MCGVLQNSGLALKLVVAALRCFVVAASRAACAAHALVPLVVAVLVRA